MSDVKKILKEAAIQIGSGGSAGERYCCNLILILIGCVTIFKSLSLFLLKLFLEKNPCFIRFRKMAPLADNILWFCF